MGEKTIGTQSKGTMFPLQLTNEVISKVKGKSSLVKLAKQEAVAFNGNQYFVFSMDNEIDIVAENGAKKHGGIQLEPKKVVPLKVEYGARVSDEFLIATEEEKINILGSFIDGFSKKVAKGLDLMVMHGKNPRTGEASSIIGNNCFAKTVTTEINYTESNPDLNIEDAVSAVQAEERTVTGIAMAPAFATALAKKEVNGVRQYPEFAWGSSPDKVNGLSIDVNPTVSSLESNDKAIVGDFENMFKWGYAKEIPMQIIEYGDPDNSGKDLKGHNQVYIRAELYLGWAILDEKAFVRIKQG